MRWLRGGLRIPHEQEIGFAETRGTRRITSVGAGFVIQHRLATSSLRLDFASAGGITNPSRTWKSNFKPETWNLELLPARIDPDTSTSGDTAREYCLGVARLTGPNTKLTGQYRFREGGSNQLLVEMEAAF
jgi:hypothetical protein